jgi:predicted MFS family arabinose efflux permease
VFLAGATMPTAAATVGWRWALLVVGLITLIATAATGAWLGQRELATGSVPGHRSPVTEPLPKLVRQVAIYAFLLGMTAGGVNRFYPLYAQEVLGYTEATAGLAVSVAGLAAILARLVWARLAITLSARPALIALALGSAVAAGLLVVTELVAAWILWPTVILAAFTVSAWNVVAMLAVIWSVPTGASGRATGIVLMGFLGGHTISAPAVGLAVDQLGSYRPTWIGLGLLALVGAVTVRRTTPSRSLAA